MKAPIAITMLSLGVWITGCGQQTGDDVGGAIESGGAAVSDAASEAGRSASEGATSVQESAGQTVEAAKVVADDAGAAVDDATTQATEGMAGLVDKARSTLEGVEGGPAMLQNVTAYIEKAKEALSSITDKESAEAAVARLGELDGSLEGVDEKIATLPDDAKTSLAGVIEKGQATLSQLVEKANQIPGVKEIIQPKIDEMMQKLSALTAKE